MLLDVIITSTYYKFKGNILYLPFSVLFITISKHNFWEIFHKVMTNTINAVFAPNILASNSQKEFIQELEYQRLVHSYAQFEEGVINSSSKLFGGAGTYLQLQKDREQLLKVFPDRDETIKRMKKGEIAYKASLFGACTNPDSCEKISFTAITSCLNCAHAIFDIASAEKMNKAVQRLQRVRDAQVQGSLLYGQMDRDIVALNKTIQKIKTINIEV